MTHRLLKWNLLALLATAPAWAQPFVPPDAGPPPAEPPPASPIDPRLEALEQQQRILSRKLELAEEKEAEKAKTRTSASANASGFSLKSADGNYQVRIRGLLQVDGRGYVDNANPAVIDTFLLRRARPIVEATLFGLIDVRLVPDFAESRVVLFDAYADVRPWTWLKLRAGKFKSPVGLERLQAASNIVFAERALPTALVPNRDIGAMLHGEVAKGTLAYAIGVFNGVPDGANGDSDSNDGKDLAARLFLHPLRSLESFWWDNLGIGVAGTFGRQRGSAAANLSAFRSGGQQAFFSYLADPMRADATVLPNGDRYRLSPQGYWYVGSLGLLAEWAYSAQEVRKGALARRLGHQAWQVAASYVVTGELASYEGIAPKRPLDLREGGWGALEVAVRYNELQVDDAAFPDFADASKSARQARAFAVAANWYLTRQVRFGLDFERTVFTLGGAGGVDRAPENFITGRLQANF